jgi:membrane protease YdiL (CAAX protease family)
VTAARPTPEDPAALTALPATARPGSTGSAAWSIWGVSFDARVAQAIGLGMLILIVGFNNHFMQGEYERFLLQFCVPIALMVLIWREDPRRYGLVVGNWRLGLPIALGGIAIMAPIIWYLGHQPDFIHYYAPLVAGRPGWRLVLEAGLDMFAWEFFFRGWLLWTFGRKYGADAILLQSVPFVLMHLLKPELEQLSTILGGLFFGLLAWKTRSFLWGFVLHWFMVAFVLVVAGGLAG